MVKEIVQDFIRGEENKNSALNLATAVHDSSTQIIHLVDVAAILVIEVERSPIRTTLHHLNQDLIILNNMRTFYSEREWILQLA